MFLIPFVLLLSHSVDFCNGAYITPGPAVAAGVFDDEPGFFENNGILGLLVTSRQTTDCPTPGAGAELCDADTPCGDSSCCSSCGICGYGPDFCDDCTSNCDAVAMCGPYGDQSLNDGKCGMNICCSSAGWCGTTDAYCTDTTASTCQPEYGSCGITEPKTCGTGSGTTSGRTIAYYQGSNVYERLCNQISPSDIDTSKYTHLYYAFASIDPDTFALVPANDEDETIYPQFTALKTSGVETWIAVGGFDFSDSGTATHTTWSDMVSTSSNRLAFITSLMDFMDTWGFQGVDLDWEYPVDADRGGSDADTQNYVALVQEMSSAFAGQYGISVTLAPDYWYLRYFDAISMQPYVSWFGFMAYDLHGSWDASNPNLGALVRGQSDITEIQNDIAPLYFDGLDFSKINFGLAYYGRGYTLSEPTLCNTLGCSFSGASKPAICTNTAGVMSLTEIESMIAAYNITPILLEDQMMKSIAWADQWIGYDDDDTIALKKAWADNYCFGGTMAWSVDFNSGAGNAATPPDTTDGTCGPSVGFLQCTDTFGLCCSASGYCGSTDAYCGSGCELLSGECLIGATSNDNTCGVSANGALCGESENGPCCSASGYCGFGEDFCGDGCQSGCDQWALSAAEGEIQTFGPLGSDSSCWDILGPTKLSQELWDDLDTANQLKDWFDNTYKAVEKEGWLQVFASQVGLGTTFSSCTVQDPCSPIDCSALVDYEHEDGTGWIYFVLVAATNLNIFFNGLWEACSAASSQFSGNQASITDTFYPSTAGTTQKDTFIFTALGALVSSMFSLGSPAVAAVGALTAGGVAEILAGMSSDPLSFDSIETLVEAMADVFTERAPPIVQDAFTSYFTTGTWTQADQTVATLLADGSWLDASLVPMVGTTATTITEVSNAMFQLIMAGIVDYSWTMQYVFMACYPMDEATFDNTVVRAGSNDGRLKYFYAADNFGTLGCYFQSAEPYEDLGIYYTKTFNPPGWGTLGSDPYDFTTTDVMASSLQSWIVGGYNYSIGSSTDFVTSFGPGVDLATAFSTAGLFNIPICIPNSSDDADAGEFSLDGTPEIGINTFFDSLTSPNSDTQYPVWCYCINIKDENGLKFLDLFPGLTDEVIAAVCY